MEEAERILDEGEKQEGGSNIEDGDLADKKTSKEKKKKKKNKEKKKSKNKIDYNQAPI